MSSPVDAAVAPLRVGVDDLLAGDLTRLSGAQIAELVEAIEVERRRLTAVDHRLLSEVVDRDIAGDYGTTSPAALLVQRLRIAPGEARARLAQAGEAGPRHELSGEPLAPVLPVAAEAVRAGEISAAHLRVISGCLSRIPDQLAVEATSVAEAFLVQAACHENPRALERTAEVLLLRLDPDGRRPREDEVERRRDVDLYEGADGTGRLRGTLTAEATAIWRTIFDVLAAPVSGDEPDSRSAGQRRHDAFLDIADRLLRSGTLPAAGGVPLTVLLAVDLADVRGSAGPGGGPGAGPASRTSSTNSTGSATERTDVAADLPPGASTDDLLAAPAGSPTEAPIVAGIDEELRSWVAGAAADELGAPFSGQANTSHGAVWSMRQLFASVCEAAIVPVLFNEAGGVLAYGRTRRLASSGQRLVLMARDRGCVFPGCDAPGAWCQVHHVIEWLDGGPTDIANMCLLCRYHHRHFAQLGWRVVMTRSGVPQWIPPSWIDAEQRPRRNTVHRVREYTFPIPSTVSVPAGGT